MTNVTNIGQAKERRIAKCIRRLLTARKIRDLRELERDLTESSHTMRQGSGVLTFGRTYMPNGNPDDMDGYKAEITRDANALARENLTAVIHRLRLPLPPKV